MKNIKIRFRTRPHIFPGCRINFIPLERQAMLRLLAYQQDIQEQEQQEQQQHLCPVCGYTYPTSCKCPF